MSDVYEPGSVEKVLTLSALIDAGQGHPAHPARGAGRAGPRGPADPRLVPARADPPDPGRRDRQVLQHRHRAGRRQVRQRRAALLPHEVRPRPAHGHRGARRDAGHPARRRSQWTHQVQDRIAFGQSLSVNAVQMAAAVNTIANGGVRVSPSLIQGRRPPTTAPWSAATHDHPPGGQREGRPRHRAHDGARGRPRRRRRPRCRRARLPGRRQDRHRAARRRASAAATTAPSRSPSPASRRPTTRASPSTWWSRTPATAAVVARSRGPAFSKIMSYALRRYAVPPTGTQPSRLPVEW